MCCVIANPDQCSRVLSLNVRDDAEICAVNCCAAYRFEEATYRTTRWLDRCLKAHSRPQEQSLFAIVQGGLDARLREISLKVC